MHNHIKNVSLQCKTTVFVVLPYDFDCYHFFFIEIVNVTFLFSYVVRPIK